MTVQGFLGGGKISLVAIDCVADPDDLKVLVDNMSPERRLDARQELAILARAFDSLSDKCQDVVWLRRVEGLSQRDTGQRLGLREGAVESQLAPRVTKAYTFHGAGESVRT